MFFYVDQKYTKETGGPKVSETAFFLFFVYKGAFNFQPTLIKLFFSVSYENLFIYMYTVTDFL